MGSQESDRFITVLVTGFEAFQDKFPINPSFEIARSLPKVLKSRDGRSPSVRIILHEPAVKVVYEHVFELIPRLLSAYQEQIDMVLHIGMASGRNFYTIERYAHRDGYTRHRDLDGKVLDEDYGSIHFSDCASKMTTSLDYEQLWEDWWSHASADHDKDEDIALERKDLCRSDDAGSFLCDFIYLNSLAFYARHATESTGAVSRRPVMFLHVPADSDERSIRRGTVVATAVVRAMADQIACQ